MRNSEALPNPERAFWTPPPPALKSVLESANPRMDSEGASGCPWSTARATAPSPGQPTPGVVKQDKSSGGSVDTTKTRSGPQRVRMCSGKRPIGGAKGKQSDTEALCHPPPPHAHAAAGVESGTGLNPPTPPWAQGLRERGNNGSGTVVDSSRGNPWRLGASTPVPVRHRT